MKAATIVVALLAVSAVATIDDLFAEIDDSFLDSDRTFESINSTCTKNQCGKADFVSTSYWCSKFTGWDQNCCNCIAKAESGGDAHFCSGTSDGSEEIGLFAVSQQYWASCSGGKAPCDPDTNLQCAQDIYKQGNNSFKLFPSCGKCNCCSNKPVSCKPFADAQWNCATAACTSKVNASQPQPDYQSAEFGARTLASAGLLPLSTTSPQSAYGNWHYNGVTYDLLWTSSQSGGKVGLEDAVKALGWTNAGTNATAITDCAIVLANGPKGAYSHVFVGVAPGLLDGHGPADYHKTAKQVPTINAIWLPPHH